LLEISEVFPKEDNGAISTIIQKLKMLIVPKNEYIIRKGEIANEMYFIVKGSVKVIDEQGNSIAVLDKGKHFGEMALLDEVLSVRNASVVTISDVSVAVLTS
jgi:CRP-like cAMP-binding protein